MPSIRRGPQGASRTPRRAAALAVLLLAALLDAALAPAGRAVIIASGDGTGNVEAPPDDPGFAHVGDAGLSVVYLRNGWVVSANHVPLSAVRLQGELHRGVEGSKRRLWNTDGFARPDLAVWKIHPKPDLPELPIRETPPEPGTPVVLVGHGLDRGERTEWNEYVGWRAGSSGSTRWGTNTVHRVGLDLEVTGQAGLTRSFTTRFDLPGTRESRFSTKHEAHVANGDSGGAAFVKNGDRWELAGTLYAQRGHAGQPSNLALEGNLTLIADLSYYRDEILQLTSRPACSDGVDDDFDARTDYPEDPGCASAKDNSENADHLPCDDGRDNDGDLGIDYPEDAGCDSPTDETET